MTTNEQKCHFKTWRKGDKCSKDIEVLQNFNMVTSPKPRSFGVIFDQQTRNWTSAVCF